DGDVTVAGDNIISDELCEFLKVIGFSTVFLSYENAKRLGMKISSYGLVMQSIDRSNDYKSFNFTYDFDFKEIYTLVKSNFDNIGDFEEWYPDISHRVRHNTCDIICISDDNQIVACAMRLFKTEKACIIGCVVTDKKYRNKGFATALVKKLSYNFDGDIYLFTEKEKNYELYKKSGFEKISRWAIGEGF
ncbi:MAG: GNAT family N-acetyltransferase, partial [Clostridiales bacterium]|nr:GNAT family N-acetyltransferase [Clostridiales bacterium]